MSTKDKVEKKYSQSILDSSNLGVVEGDEAVTITENVRPQEESSNDSVLSNTSSSSLVNNVSIETVEEVKLSKKIEEFNNEDSKIDSQSTVLTYQSVQNDLPVSGTTYETAADSKEIEKNNSNNLNQNTNLQESKSSSIDTVESVDFVTKKNSELSEIVMNSVKEDSILSNVESDEYNRIADFASQTSKDTKDNTVEKKRSRNTVTAKRRNTPKSENNTKQSKYNILQAEKNFNSEDNDANTSIERISSKVKIEKEKYTSDNLIVLPVLALKDVVCFPGFVSPLFVGRNKSIAAVERAMTANSGIFLVSEKLSNTTEVRESNLFKTGCVAKIIQKIRLPNDTLKVLVDVEYRAEMVSTFDTGSYIEAVVQVVKDEGKSVPEIIAMMRFITDQLHNYSLLSKSISTDVMDVLSAIDDPSVFVDLAMSHINVKHKKKQDMLETRSVAERLQKLATLLEEEIDILQAERSVQERLKGQVDKNHREYYLNEQIKAIRKELGESDGSDSVEKYEAIIKERNFPPVAQEKLTEEIKRLRSSNAISGESVRSYIDWMISLPWGKVDNLSSSSVSEAVKILDRTHYGLQKVKGIILEYIAVQTRRTNPKGVILCLYGSPGIGKTTLVKSIAEAMGRKYAKISLGGVRDEAEIRGHRRTYIAAMPGRIIQAIKRIGTDNAVILLDEIDKMAHDYRGDPESALLEALDPEQNDAFQDHYLEIGYDLSKTIFIATANSLQMQRALLDRLEIVHVPSYLEHEKLEICKNYILPKVLEENCIDSTKFAITDDAILHVIKNYTMESGVRELTRLMGKISRKSLLKIIIEEERAKQKIILNEAVLNTVSEDEKMALFSNDNLQQADESVNALQEDNAQISQDNTVEYCDGADLIEVDKIEIGQNGQINVNIDNVKRFLGVSKYDHDSAEKSDIIGVTNGLAYTDFGGEILMIEAVKIHGGKGEIKITGKLGDVMKESAQAAASYVRSRFKELGIKDDAMKDCDIHIHFPAGAVPKDGPSAGVAICTSIISLLTGISVKRSVAMTGEITLRGRVLRIGGLREKMVAALRAGITTVLIPIENARDLEEIPAYVKEQLEIVFCDTVDTVILHALTEKISISSINEDESFEISKQNQINEAINGSPSVVC